MKLDENFEKRMISDMFYAISKMCNNLNEQIRMGILDLNCPQWGIECETKDKKYQLVLELKEVEK